MVKITNLETGSSYTPPMGTTVTLDKQIQLTQLPIPMLDLPILLNFGGAQPTLTIQFVTNVQADIALLMQQFSSASETQGYSIDLTAEWGSGIVWATNGSGTPTTTGVVNGYIYEFSIKQAAGEGQKWDVTLTFYLGMVT